MDIPHSFIVDSSGRVVSDGAPTTTTPTPSTSTSSYIIPFDSGLGASMLEVGMEMEIDIDIAEAMAQVTVGDMRGTSPDEDTNITNNGEGEVIQLFEFNLADYDGQEFIDIGNLMTMQSESRGIGGFAIDHEAADFSMARPYNIVPLANNVEAQKKVFVDESGGDWIEARGGAQQDNNFVCSTCGKGFDKKLSLNNHLKSKHGINYVFTEKGKKVRVVRLPEEEEEMAMMDMLDTERIGGGEDGDMVGSSQPQPQSQTEKQEVEEAKVKEDPDMEKMLKEDHGHGPLSVGPTELGCGFAVNIETDAYKVCKEKGDIPFVAFLPILSKHVYLMKVKEINAANQLLEPANKADVLEANEKQKERGSPETEGGTKLAIVAFVHQIFDKVSKGTEIIIGPPLVKPNEPTLRPKVMSLDRFTHYAFSSPDLDAMYEEEEDEETSDDNSDQEEEEDEEEEDEEEHAPRRHASPIVEPPKKSRKMRKASKQELLKISRAISPSQLPIPMPKTTFPSPPLPTLELVTVAEELVKSPAFPTLQLVRDDIDVENRPPRQPGLQLLVSTPTARPLMVHKREPFSPHPTNVIKPEPMSPSQCASQECEVPFAPARKPPAPASKARRGRPRKLNFDNMA